MDKEKNSLRSLLLRVLCVRSSVTCVLIVIACVLIAGAQPATFDLVIRGGRVIDPETNLDAVRDVGITGGRIAAVSAEPLTGTAVIDARGPGGLAGVHRPPHARQRRHDLSPRGAGRRDHGARARDRRAGRGGVPRRAAREGGDQLRDVRQPSLGAGPRVRRHAPADAVVPASQRGTEAVAGEAERQAIRARLEHEIDAGALGIGMGLVYTPGATRAEAIDAFRVAAARRVPVFVHVRSSGRLEPGSSIESVGEVIAAVRRDRRVAAHRPHQQQLHGGCARVPQDDRRRAGARARRHGRGLSVRRGHDRPEVVGLQSGHGSRRSA